MRRLGVSLGPLAGLQKCPAAFWLNIVVKAALICLLVFGAFSGLQQFEGKAFLWRLATYPIATLVIPVIWAVRYRRASYPFASDILLTLPFLIDTTGNALDFTTQFSGGTMPTIWSTGRCSPALSECWLDGAASGLGKYWRSWWDSERSLPSCGRSPSILPSYGARRSLQPPTLIRLATWRWALPGRFWLAWQLLCGRARLS